MNKGAGVPCKCIAVKGRAAFQKRNSMGGSASVQVDRLGKSVRLGYKGFKRKNKQADEFFNRYGDEQQVRSLKLPILVILQYLY